MSSHFTPALLSVLAVSVISFIGVLTLFFARLKHMVLVGFVAFATGTLLGDSFFHLLPEAVDHFEGFGPDLGLFILIGFLFFFLFETALRWQHAHGEGEHPHSAPPTEGKVAPFAWANLVGDGIHNFVDGILIGAAYLVSFPVGIATTVAVAAHEIPQEVGDFAILVRAGMKKQKALLYNFLSALTAVAGTLLVLVLPLLAGDPETATDTIVRYALPLIAGGFIYIAAADLIPELHHHAERRYIPMILTAMLLGLLVMAALLLLEPPGQH